MKIEPFAVEIWMNEWETRCAHNLAETCVDSISVETMLRLAGRSADDLADLWSRRMTYGDIEGSERLRAAVAALYDGPGPEDVVIAHGAIGANMLAYKALVGPGDRVVSLVPTYQQHTAIPAALGAEVATLRLRPEDGYLPDLDRLRALVAPGTRLVSLVNPNNPTGALIERPMLEEIARIAESASAYVLCDEVYRGTEQVGVGVGETASIADVYAKGITVGSLSKAFSLAGLRVGWAVAPEEVRAAMLLHRDYDTISVGAVNDRLAALALEAKDALLGRSRDLVRRNHAILAEWMEGEPRISWVAPRAGTTALLRIDGVADARVFCVDLLRETGTMLTPGDCFDEEGQVRIGYACDTETLRRGLEALSGLLKRSA